ncbi:MAG TPA: SdpI family protein [Vicinamibacterales bacterium]|jgi:hypothetical protein
MLRFTVFVMGVHGAVLLAVLGLLSGRRWAAELVPLMLGFTMISVGNLLPRTRPNLAIGIRTQLTLSNRAVWIRVHRRAGYLVVACGAVITADTAVLCTVAVIVFGLLSAFHDEPIRRFRWIAFGALLASFLPLVAAPEIGGIPTAFSVASRHVAAYLPCVTLLPWAAAARPPSQSDR